MSYASVTSPDRVIERGFEEISGLGSMYVVLVYMAFLEAVGEKATNRILALAVLINGSIVLALKQLFAAPRPEGGEHFLTASFPSGHASTAFVLASVLSWRYPKLKYLFFPVAAMVAIGRVAIDAHHVHDVVVGAAIGLAVGTMTAWKAEDFVENRV